MLEREREIHENIFLERTNKSFSLFFFGKIFSKYVSCVLSFCSSTYLLLYVLVGINDLH